MSRPDQVVCVAAIAVFASLSAGCTKPLTTVDPTRLKTFAPLPEVSVAADASAAARVELGRMLYYDARLSKSQTISCNTCHPLTKYGADGQPTSPGHGGRRGARNSPTVYNAALQFVQFWDGRAPDVEAQAQGPMLNPVEMAMPSDKAVVAVLKSIPRYAAAFRSAYPGDKDPVTLNHASEAIGAFERGLVTPSRWDRFLKGDEPALTPEEKAGFNSFVSAGCVTCHSGTLVGGGAFQKLGAVKSYPVTSDPGRFGVTHSERDRLFFKVPTLRNVAMTGPYFHDGKVSTLEDAVVLMGEYQTGKPLDAREINAIVAWLGSLTGELPAGYIQQPELPASTARTPVSGD